MGLLEKLFSWPGFSVWTKISYTVYLTQFPIFFYNVGTTRNPQHYEFFEMMFNIEEILCIILSSIVLTVLFEMPFQNLRNLIFKKSKPISDNVKLSKKMQ